MKGHNSILKDGLLSIDLQAYSNHNYISMLLKKLTTKIVFNYLEQIKAMTFNVAVNHITVYHNKLKISLKCQKNVFSREAKSACLDGFVAMLAYTTWVHLNIPHSFYLFIFPVPQFSNSRNWLHDKLYLQYLHNKCFLLVQINWGNFCIFSFYELFLFL